MKKFLLIFVSILLLFTTGCGNGTGTLAKSPAEEYERVSNLYGENSTYNFGTLSYFEAKHSTKIYGDKIVEANGAPVEIALNYKLDKSDLNNVKSYCEYDSLLYFDINSKAVFEDVKKTAFIKDKFYPENTTFIDFDAFLKQASFSADYMFNSNSSLPPAEIFSSVTGEKNQGQYFIFCIGDNAEAMQFLNWFDSVNSLMNWKQSEGLFKVFYLDSVKDFKLSLKTTTVGLVHLETEFKARGFDNLGDIIIRSSTMYYTSKVSVPDKWE